MMLKASIDSARDWRGVGSDGVMAAKHIRKPERSAVKLFSSAEKARSCLLHRKRCSTRELRWIIIPGRRLNL